MISLCKTVHTLLGFPDLDGGGDDRPHRRCRSFRSYDSAGLRLIAGEPPPPSPISVIESSAFYFFSTTTQKEELVEEIAGRNLSAPLPSEIMDSLPTAEQEIPCEHLLSQSPPEFMDSSLALGEDITIDPPVDAGQYLLSPRPQEIVEASQASSEEIANEDLPSSPPAEKEIAGEVSGGDPGGWGLYSVQDRGGMGLCTESLGFESCDDRIADGPVPSAVVVGGDEDDIISHSGGDPARWSGRRRRAEGLKFPPPLPWLVGRRSYLKGVRKDGRLQLTEITVTERRPKILRASRQNGWLRLELLVRTDLEEEESTVEMEEPEDELAVEKEEVKLPWWEGPRCQEPAVGGNPIPHWLNHRFVTTA